MSIPPMDINLGEKYEFVCALGRGSYGTVIKASQKDGGEDVAIKIFPENEEDESIDRSYLREMEFLKTLHSQYISGFIEKYDLGRYRFIVMELFEAGSVHDLNKMCDARMEEPFMKDMTVSVLLGLEYLESELVVHRDIKAGNILLTMDGRAKLGDFGVSARLQDEEDSRKSVIGTPYWMAPEMVNAAGYSFKCDVWALGVTLIEVADGEPPYSNIDPMRTVYMIAQRPAPNFRKPKMFSKDLRNFCAECLVKEQHDRKGASELLSHPWIAEAVKQLTSSDVNMRSEAMRLVVEEYIDEIREFRAGNFLSDDDSHPSRSDADTAIFIPLNARTAGGTHIPTAAAITKTKKRNAPILRLPSRLASEIVEGDTIDLDNAREMVELHDRFMEIEKQFRYDIKGFAALYNKRKKALLKLLEKEAKKMEGGMELVDMESVEI